MDDHTILELFLRRDETAIRLAEEKYGAYCAAVARNILEDPADVEEVLSDTWLRVWNAIPPQRPVRLKLYLARITRNLAHDRFRSLHREKRGGGKMTLALEELKDCLPAQSGPEDAVNAGELQRAVNRFLAQLPGRDRDIFLRRYFFVEDFASIARRHGIKETSVRTILSRTRKKLKTCLEKEGYL